MRYFDNFSIRDVKTSYSLRRDYFSTFKYNVQIDPQDYRINGFRQNVQRDGLEPINKK